MFHIVTASGLVHLLFSKMFLILSCLCISMASVRDIFTSAAKALCNFLLTIVKNLQKSLKISFFSDVGCQCILKYHALKINIFKINPNISFAPPPPLQVIGVWESEDLSFLFQFRVGLSRLNCHKIRHNFRDTLSPLYLINDGIKDMHHYFLLCHAYIS